MKAPSDPTQEIPDDAFALKHEKILSMLSYRRPAGGPGEKAFLQTFLMPHKPELVSTNYRIVVPGGNGKTLFSCHTDTVHHNDKRQQVIYDQSMETAYKIDKEPLGADNTAGVWLLLEMIIAKMPGTYMFHYGEERGCLGSKQMLREHRAWLEGFDKAIAFDRRGTTSIITHQMRTRTCSDEFGDALAAALGNGFERDDTGLYTDTASYSGVIKECSNVSVGYHHEHGPDESLDLEHLVLLRELVLKVDWDKLPAVRKTEGWSAREGKPWTPQPWRGNTWEGETPAKKEVVIAKPMSEFTADSVDFYCEAALAECDTFEETLKMCQKDPEYFATMLYSFVVRENDYVDMLDTDAEEEPEPSIDKIVRGDPEVRAQIAEIIKQNFPDFTDRQVH